MKRVLLFLLALVFLVSGCGGGGSSTPAGTARLRMSIQWAARERSFNAPTSALVALLKVQSADGDVYASQRIYRHADIAAYTEQIETRMSLAPGNYQVAVWFYPTVDSDFFHSAYASLSCKVNDQGEMVTTDGKPLGTVTTVGTIWRLVTYDNFSIAIGAESPFPLQALTNNLDNLALTPGAIKVVRIFGDDLGVTFKPDGVMTCTNPGRAQYYFEVDGVKSSTVFINSFAVRKIPLKAQSLAKFGSKVLATVAPAEGGSPRLVEVNPETGTQGRSVTLPAWGFDTTVSSDSSIAYVVHRATKQISKVDLTNFTVLNTFNITTTDSSGIVQSPWQVAISPNDPDVIAVSFKTDSSGYVTIYDKGVARENVLDPYCGTALTWLDSSTIVVQPLDVIPQSLTLAKVTDKGIEQTKTLDDWPGTNSDGYLSLVGDYVYSSDGSAISKDFAQVFSSLGSKDIAFDPSQDRLFLLDSSYVLRTGTISTRQIMRDEFQLPRNPFSAENDRSYMMTFGNKSIVYRVEDSINVAGPFPGL